MRAISASTAWICGSIPSSSRVSLNDILRVFVDFVAASRESADDLFVAVIASLCRDAATVNLFRLRYLRFLLFKIPAPLLFAFVPRVVNIAL